MRAKTILVPTDFSAGAASALEAAADIAAAAGGRIVLLAVNPVLPIDPRDAGMWPLDRTEQMRQCLQEVARCVKVPCEVEVEVGDAATHIVECAKKHAVDLIVMATHGRRGLARVILGSVAEEVLRGASCPVMCVPPGWTGVDDAHGDEIKIGLAPEALREVGV